MFQNTFNYSSPEYQFGMNLSINLRNRQAKADQFRAVLEYRQKQIAFEEQKKTIRFDVRNSQFALQQAQARVDAAQKARDLAQHTFDVTDAGTETRRQVQLRYAGRAARLWASPNRLWWLHRRSLKRPRWDIDRATGTTLDQTGVSIDDAKTGVVTRAP